MKTIIFTILIIFSFAVCESKDRRKAYKCKHIGISKIKNKKFNIKAKPLLVKVMVLKPTYSAKF